MFSESIIAENCFDEVAIADFQHFQIAIPARKFYEKRRIFSHPLLIPKRVYSDLGWMLANDTIISLVTHIKIQTLVAPNIPLQPIYHLGANVPVSFESRSGEPLARIIKSQAAFSCYVNQSPAPFCSVFRQARPRFVNVYPFNGIDSTAGLVKQMLTDEKLFLRKHLNQLKFSPFYQKQFNL